MTFKRTVSKRFWRWAYASATSRLFDQGIVKYETFETFETSRLKN